MFCESRLAQELLEYQSNQVSGIEIKRTLANENAIIDKLKAVFQNKITVKIELNSMNLYKTEYRKYCGLFDLHSSYCGGYLI
jgi:hypothetical protein